MTNPTGTPPSPVNSPQPEPGQADSHHANPVAGQVAGPVAKSATDSLIEPRRSYVTGTLSREQLDANPMTQFERWLGDARAEKLIDATAMMLSTVDPSGQPTSRVVLLKGIDERGFTFYTNHDSSKGLQLKTNPKAAVLFYWQKLERQVRIQGTVTQLPAADADEYFYSRPEGSRFSAAASAQSSPVANRSELETAVASLKEQYPDGNVPRPANWGGYLLSPNYLEFWQGRDDRLHDRFIYETAESPSTSWSVQRLSP